MATSPLMRFIEGREARRQQDAVDAQNAMRAFVGQRGADIFAGDTNALGQLAGMGPEGLQMAFDVRGNVNAERRAGEADQRAAAAGAREEWRFKREAEEYAKSITAEQAAQQYAAMEGGLKAASAAKTPQEWDDLVTRYGIPQLVGEFANREAHIAKFLPWAEVLKMRAGEQGEAFTLSPGQTRFGPDGKPVAAVPAKPDTASLSPQAKLYAEEQSGAVPKGTFAQTYGADPLAAEKARLEIEKLRKDLGAPPKPTAAEEQIARLVETGMDRDTAIGIADGRLKLAQDPLTRDFTVVDMATGRPVNGTPPPAPGGPPLAPAGAPPALDFGQQFPDAPAAFGVPGFVAGAVNTATDALGMGAAFPEVQAAQADFAVLGERLLNDVASGYDRPPSWLLQNIRNLNPQAGSPWEGPEAAQAKLRAIGRDLQGELQSVETQLQGRLAPDDREVLRKQSIGLKKGLARISTALGALQPQGGVTVAPEVEERLKAYD